MPSEEGVGELVEFRRVLQVAALRFCFARRREETLRQMRTTLVERERAQDADDRLGLAWADTAFHQAIAENSANQYLIGACRLMSGGIAALRTHNLLATEKVRENVVTQHRALIAAIAKGELERVEDILADHVLKMRIRYRTQRGREPAVESA